MIKIIDQTFQTIFYQYIKKLLSEINMPDTSNITNTNPPYRIINDEQDTFSTETIRELKEKLILIKTSNNTSNITPFIKINNNVQLYKNLYEKNMHNNSILTYEQITFNPILYGYNDDYDLTRLDNLDINLYFKAIIYSRILMLFKLESYLQCADWTHPELFLDFSIDINNLLSNDILNPFFYKTNYNDFSFKHLYIFKYIAFPPFIQNQTNYIDSLYKLYRVNFNDLNTITMTNITTITNNSSCLAINDPNIYFNELYDILNIGINRFDIDDYGLPPNNNAQEESQQVIQKVKQQQFILNLLHFENIDNNNLINNYHLRLFYYIFKKHQLSLTIGGGGKKKSDWCYKLPINILNKDSLKKRLGKLKRKKKKIKKNNIFKSILTRRRFN